MKRNFFKKLSFVLASAMVLTTLAPASGALAASGPKLNSDNKYLHLGRVAEKQNEFNFNISGKKSGWKYEWTSANTKVAKVNKKNGVVTATGVGATKVTVFIADKDGGEIDTLTAKVTVRDNIETVKISNLPKEALAVGAEYDFNRSYVTESGSSKKTSGITRWVVSPETATINDSGVFVATEAGEYTITANSFQSKAKYNDWLDDNEWYADYVTATTSEKVTVAASMDKAKQVDLDTLKVTFDTAMLEADVKSNLKVYQLLGSTKVIQSVKKIELDDDAKVATVDLYVPFSKGATYIVDYVDMESKQFVAATTDFDDVVRMTIDTTTAVVGAEPTDLEFSLYDVNDVNITDGVDSIQGGNLKDRVEFKTTSNEVHLDGNKISIFNIGTVVPITATYHTWDYDVNGNEIGAIIVSGSVVGVKEATVVAGALQAYTVVEETKNADWDNLNTKVAIGDNFRLIVKVKDTADKEYVSFKDKIPNSEFKFETSNNNILIVDTNGGLYPVKEGSAVVVVKYGDVIVGTANVVVMAERKGTILTLDTYAISLSNDDEVKDSKDVNVTLLDQHQEKYGVTALSATYVSGVKDLVKWEPNTTDNKITFKAIAGAEGKASWKITVNDDMVRYVTVSVLKPNDDGTNITYKLDLDNTVDLAVDNDTSMSKTFNVGLYGYAPNGVKTTANVATGSTYKVEITNPDGKSVGTKGVVDLYSVSGGAISGGAITKIKTGTYRVLAKDGTGKVINSNFFTVTDSQVAPKVEVTTLKYTPSTSVAVAEECFDIKVGDDTLEIVDVTFVGGGFNGSDNFIKSVVARQKFTGGNYIDHTVNVGLTVIAN